MSKMAHKILALITATRSSFGLIVVTFLALLVTRLSIENLLFSYPPRGSDFIFLEFTHLGLLTLLTFFLFLPLIRSAWGLDFRSAVQVMTFGLIAMPLPPILDKLIMGNHPYVSFYEFDGLSGLGLRFLTFFGDTPTIGITYGPRIITALTVLLFIGFTFALTQRLGRALLAGLWSYALLFFIGTLPSWITLVVLAFEKNILSLTAADVAGLFFTPIAFFSPIITHVSSTLNLKMSLCLVPLLILTAAVVLRKNYPDMLRALIANARFPQMFYHLGLLGCGLLLALIFTESVFSFNLFHLLGLFSLATATLCAWLASVVVNDLYDISIDQLTNAHRPLIVHTISLETYRVWGGIFFLLSLLFSGLVSFSALFLLLGYQAIAWIYSAPPLRLKRFPGLATLLAALAGLLVLFMGYIVLAPDHTLQHLPLPLILFLFVAYTLSLPLKDFKDIAGDATDGVYTLPVLLGETRAKQLLGSLMFLVYVFSPLILHARVLFFPAILFGSLTFFIIQRATALESAPLAFRKLPAILLSLIALYGLSIAYFLFVP